MELENGMREIRRMMDGKNAGNGMGILVRRIRLGMQGVFVEIRKVWRIRVAMQGIKVES